MAAALSCARHHPCHESKCLQERNIFSPCLQVFQVRKKDTGQIYAMKVMRKEKVLEKEHGEYVRAESQILKTVLHPYIVTLRYSFQVTACPLQLSVPVLCSMDMRWAVVAT